MKKEILVRSYIIDLFNNSLESTEVLNFNTVNKKTVKCGYLVHPNVCSMDVLDYVLAKQIDYNSTFYKKWSSIIEKNRFELLIDQLLHYASTYGTNFIGKPYIPETIDPTDVPPFTEFNVIGIIGKDEVISRCENILFSGIALKQETIEKILEILNYFDYYVNVTKVKNREAKMLLYKNMNVLPDDPIEMIKFLVYLATGKTNVIKNDAMILEIRVGQKIDLRDYVENFGAEKLSQVFYRFKPIFLAFKYSKPNRKVVNKLRKLAKKNHVPMKKGFFEFLLTDEKLLDQLTKKKLEEISNFKKVLLLQTINIKLKKITPQAYVVRNQKLWIETNPTNSKIDDGRLISAFFLIYESLIESLKKKACKISLPKNINLKLPTSAKSFIGNFPCGTSFDLSDKDAIFGINWRESEGARDIDLSYHDISGNKIGWNSDFYNDDQSIIYSGDVTTADPEATELLYAENGMSVNFAGIVNVNLYRGSSLSNYDMRYISEEFAMPAKFKIFLATEKITNLHKNYMVNPNNVLFTIDMEMDSQQKSLGVLANNKFILVNFRTGKGRVSRCSVTDLYTHYAIAIEDCYISMQQVLTDAGFIITDNNPDIDLKNLSVDSLISLLS